METIYLFIIVAMIFAIGVLLHRHERLREQRGAEAVVTHRLRKTREQLIAEVRNLQAHINTIPMAFALCSKSTQGQLRKAYFEGRLEQLALHGHWVRCRNQLDWDLFLVPSATYRVAANGPGLRAINAINGVSHSPECSEKLPKL